MNDDDQVLVLLVEDQEFRGQRILELLRHERVRITWARTAAAAIAIVRRSYVDLVLLDYDLDEAGGKRDLNAPNGGVVARTIAGLPATNRPDFVVIHSMNPRGRLDMLSVLEAANIAASVRPMDSWDEQYAGTLLRELGL